jgi:quinol monooxygenase YgiN
MIITPAGRLHPRRELLYKSSVLGDFMITVLTTYRVTKGQESAFEGAFSQLQQQVIAKESGTVAFQLYRAAGKGESYKVIAHFSDEAAMASHNAGPYLKSAAKLLFSACGTPPEAEIFQTV